MKKLLLILLVTIAFIAATASAEIVTRSLQSDHDDAEEYLNDTWWNEVGYRIGEGELESDYLEIGPEWNTVDYKGVGLQFDQLGIPHGAVITSAKITFTVMLAQVSNGSNAFTIFGEAAGNAVPWGTSGAITRYDVTSRDRTSSSVAWSPNDPAVNETIDTPDISALIQKIVKDPSWDSDHRMSLLIFPDVYLNSGSGDLTMHTYYPGGSATSAPVLTIEYTESNGAICIAPTLGSNEYTGNIDLAWINMPPVSSATYVDVWYGNDPCDLTNNPIIGQAIDSTTINIPNVKTTYWRVDSYLHGDPAGGGYGGVGEPNVVTGLVWAFNTISDLPPDSVETSTVDFGVTDMISWNSQSIALTSTVTGDDNVSAINYTWTATPAGIASFSPADDRNTTVTFTKTPEAAQLYIANSGFEIPEIANNGSIGGFGSEGWNEGWYTVSSGLWDTDVWSAGIMDPNNDAPEGENIAFQLTDAGYDMGMRQVLTSTLLPDTHYQLSVMVGNPAINIGSAPDYRVELLANGVVVDSETGPAPAPGVWTPVTVPYDSPAEVNADQALEIRLILVDDGSTSVQLNFDNVKLTATNKNYPTTAILTVTAIDGSGIPVTDSMLVDVYDTACMATRNGIGTKKAGDLDADCLVGLGDLAELAKKWLTDTGLDAPKAKF